MRHKYLFKLLYSFSCFLLLCYLIFTDAKEKTISVLNYRKMLQAKQAGKGIADFFKNLISSLINILFLKQLFRVWLCLVLLGCSITVAIPAFAGAAEENSPGLSKGLFIGAAIGPAVIDIDQENYAGNLQLLPPADSDDLNISIEAGYRFSKRFFATASYQYISTNDADIQHLFISGNIQFFAEPHIRPFIGITAGVSKMNWERTFNAIYSKDESDAVMFGPQAGLEILTDGPVSFYCTYQHLFTNMETELYLIPDVSELSYEGFQNLLFGIRYSF